MKAKQDKETRLDRIEKGIEKLFEGIGALTESQKNYSEERREAQKKIDEQILELKESQKNYSEERREAQKKIDSEILELKDSQMKTDEQLSRTIKKLDDIGRQLGDLGLVQGEVAEDLFYRNVRYLFKEERDLIFSDVKRNLKKKGSGEYDIVAVNGDAVLVIEVKNKLQNRMVDNFVEKKLPKFKKIFPEYRDRRIFGGMGALVVKDAVGRYAEKAGLYVLTQTSEGGAALTNRKNFRAKEFS
jgi:hypothetical protein